MLWHEQSWEMIGALDKSIPVIVPLGSIEQHGPHLPLCVDTAQVSAIADLAERALGDRAIFLPTLWLGCSEHHRDFPGTISVPPAIYSETIQSVASSILRSGFTRVLFLNGHGGNEIPASQALITLVAEDDNADAAHLVMASWWHIGRESLQPDKLGMATPAISHACEYETSMMLALRPDLVDLSKASASRPAIASPWYSSDYGGKVRVFHRFARLTATGNMGDPTKASPDKGKAMLAAVTADVVAFVQDLAIWPMIKRQC